MKVYKKMRKEKNREEQYIYLRLSWKSLEINSNWDRIEWRI